MSKTKKIVLPLLFIIIALSVMLFAFSELNIIPQFDLGEILGANGTASQVKSNEQIIAELETQYTGGVQKNVLPDDMNALWIDINKDITAEAEQGTDAVKYSIYSDFDYYRNFIPDVFFVKPDTENEFSGLKEPDGSSYDILAYLLYYVRSLDCEAILVADDDILLDKDGKPHTKELEKYLSEYDFNSVLISVDAAFSNPLYIECAQTVRNFVNEKYPFINVGIEVHSDFKKQFADEFTASVFHNGLADFGYLDCLCTGNDPVYPFQSVALWWNYFAEYYNIPLYCEMRLDKVFSEEGDWSFSTEINNQLKALNFCSAFDGCCFYNASVLRNKKALSRDLAIFLNDVAGTNSDAYELDSLSVRDSVVKFTGKAASGTAVFCNDKNIPVNGNRFEYSSHLNPGDNEFKFFGNGAYYVHSIFNNASLFKEYPSEADIKIDSEMMVNVRAVCPVGSVVFAVVNGEGYALSEGESVDGADCVYTCSISFYGKEIYSDKLDIVCFYGDSSEVVSCGSIKRHLLPDKEETVNVSSVLSPYSDNGLGTALMCITKYDNTEIISSVSDYDTYHPYNSSLPEGAIDYVKNINVSGEGYIRYELESGLNVYGVDAILVNNGYRLPANTVCLKNCDSSSGDVNMTFSLDWKCPVTVTVKDLEFKKGYEQFSYNIDSFNADYVDVNFYHSAQYSLADSFSLDNNPLFSSYEVLATGENVLTVRLYLRNAGAFYGYDIKYGENNTACISFNYFPKGALSGKVIMLDPGHGGISMVGTALADNSVSESIITLGIASYTKQCLEGMGAKVIMTRTMDSSLSLSERTAMCEKDNPDIFVSIHCDGSDDTEENGTHSFYYTPYSYDLAAAIHRRVVVAYQNSVYSPADPNFERVDRKVKYYPFYVTRVDNCPSVLVETGFLTNYAEGSVLANPSYQHIIGNAVAYGIMDYFS